MEFQLSDFDDLKEIAVDLKKHHQSKNRIKGVEEKISTYDRAIEIAEDYKKQYKLKNRIIENVVIPNNLATPDRRFVDIKFLTTYIGVKMPTIRDWVRFKKIPFHKKGKLIRFDLREIDEWMKEK